MEGNHSPHPIPSKHAISALAFAKTSPVVKGGECVESKETQVFELSLLPSVVEDFVLTEPLIVKRTPSATMWQSVRG